MYCGLHVSVTIIELVVWQERGLTFSVDWFRLLVQRRGDAAIDEKIEQTDRQTDSQSRFVRTICVID